jgi:hypothetical protein
MKRTIARSLINFKLTVIQLIDDNNQSYLSVCVCVRLIRLDDHPPRVKSA